MRAVLTFHSVDDLGSELSFPVRSFVEFVHGLLRSDVPIVNFDQLSSLNHGVTLTFDDAIESIRRNALPVLQEARVPAHLFVVSGRVGLDNRWDSRPSGQTTLPLMGWDEIDRCAAGGMTIECHTATHADLRGRSGDEVLEECGAADVVIERRYCRRPRLFAYPYGRFDPRVKDLIRRRYRAAFTTQPAHFDVGADPYAVPRIGSHYLRSTLLQRGLLSQVGRSYLRVRRALRAVRTAS
jgi:peptidoglycan/xylan/chitin deacetylase (PgdA/CDA1 family)